MLKQDKIYVAGHTGMVGSAIVRALQAEGYANIITPRSEELDLRNQGAVNSFFNKHRPAFVFLAAAKVGGIFANSEFPANFLYDNILINTNVIHASYLSGVNKLLFLGSSCIYPKYAQQPIREEYLLTGPLEPTNEMYAIAKIAGIKMCQAYRQQYGCNFISLMPTNLYGINDNYDLKNSHVVAALIRKIHEAKAGQKEAVTIWGTGTVLREFLYAGDLADACLFVMNNYNGKDFLNVGSGQEISIQALAHTIKSLVGYTGSILFDTSKPDGTPRKLIDSTRLLSLGWAPRVVLAEGLGIAYNDFLLNKQ